MFSGDEKEKVAVNLRKKNLNDKDNIFRSLKQKETIHEIDLSGNHLTRLPEDLSDYQKLLYLDLSGNPFENYQEIGKALSTLPRLLELKIDLFSQDHAHCILTQLPQLKYLNDNPTKEEQNQLDVDEKEIDFSSLKNEIPNFQSILKRLEKKLKGSKETFDFFYMEFEKILKTQIDIINNLDGSVSNFLYSATALQAKVEIYSYLQNKAINMLSGQVDYEVVGILKDINAFIKSNETSTVHLLKQITPKYEEQYNNEAAMKKDLTNQIDALKGRITQMQNTIENKEVSIHELSERNSKLEAQVQEMKLLLSSERRNNEKTSKIRKSEDNVPSLDIAIRGRSDIEAKEFNTNQNTSSVTSSFLGAKQESHGSMNNNNTNNYSNYPSSSRAQRVNTQISQLPGRTLSKKMLLDIINEIYQSKVIHDKKCHESKLPRETMEQHMYTYLNQKYGLKNMIIEWARGIINGIRIYSLEDSEVCLFGKILRNEIEERSLAVFDKVKNTISDFMLYFLQNQYPFKNKGEIQQMFAKLKGGFLSEEEWINITEYIFDNASEKQCLNDRIYAFIQKGQSRTWNSSNRQGKPISKEEQASLDQAKQTNEILYNDFIQLVLDFQIRLRDRYLKPFVQMFRNVDSDLNGIINEEELFSLISIFHIYPEDQINQSFEMLLNIIDPYSNKQMTFSEIVLALSNEYIFIPDMSVNNGQMVKISILDKISMQI